MRDWKRIVTSMVLSSLLVIPILSFNATSAEEEDVGFPYQSTVAFGVASGTVANMNGVDSSYYSVAEEDMNPGRAYTNDTLNPEGSGTNTEMIPVGATCSVIGNYECVNEGSPGDENVTYVQTLIPLSEQFYNDTYSTEDLSLGSGYSVDQVTVYATTLESSTDSNPGYALCVYSGATLDCSSLETLTVTYTEYWATWTTDPDTSVAWTDSGVDGLEIGHRHYWDGVHGGTNKRTTLVYAIVQSSTPLYDYVMDFTLDFQGIQYSDEPTLTITGYRSGDSENIVLQILRAGSWVTLSSNAFGAASATATYDLAKADVAGGSASVRIYDSDNTDDTQSTVYLDEVKITTIGEPLEPAAPVDVYINMDYDLWGNKVIIWVSWTQTGGREQGEETSKWATVSFDGGEERSYHVNEKLELECPWSWFDGNDHVINATGAVNINYPEWQHNQTYFSDPATLRVSNFPRWAVVLLLVFIVMAIIAVISVSAYKNAKLVKEMEEER